MAPSLSATVGLLLLLGVAAHADSTADTIFNHVAWSQPPNPYQVDYAAAQCNATTNTCAEDYAGMCFDNSNPALTNRTCELFVPDGGCGDGEVNSTCGCCLPKEQCVAAGAAVFNIGGKNITLYNKYTIFYTMGGVTVGSVGVVSIHRTRAVLLNWQIYLITFLLFACMNTAGTVCHCFVPVKIAGPGHYRSLSFWSFELDNLFTCWASVSFAICSLYDFHVLKWNLVGKLVTVVILLYFAVQLAERDDPVGWPDHNTLTHAWPPKVTKLCVPLYYVSMLLWMPLVKKSCKGFLLLLLAILCGEIAIQGLQSTTLGDTLCAMFGQFLNQDNFWYLFSNLAMAFLLLFYLDSHRTSPRTCEGEENEPLLSSDYKAMGP